MYSKGKIISVTLVALVVLAIGVVREGVMGKDKNQANIIQTEEIYVAAENASTSEVSTIVEPGHKCRGKEAFETTLKELQESGVLTETDVKKIEAYKKAEMEARKSEMKEKRNESINNMVKENVITAEKAQKLKDALDKQFER